jgi:type I restriction enzyme, S subunit
VKAKTVPSRWLLESDGRRLDCGPYMSGALEARVRLERLSARKDLLHEVTLGGHAGIFNGPRFPRKYVNDPRFGVPFLGSTDILASDLTHLPLISRKQVEALPELVAFARADMDGMAGSQHFMRVVPDSAKILPGYLYAYLSSKFGVPLIVGGTYGAIIQHIEPEHIANLAVPRFERPFEQLVHDLVQRAASLRVEASQLLLGVAARFDSLLGEIALHDRASTPRISVVSAKSIQRRFDARFHDPLVRAVRERLAQGEHTTIAKWCSRIFLPGIFKRIHVEDLGHGAPYYTGATLFWLEPQPKGVLSRRTTLFEQVRMDEGTVLVQAFGQEGGLTGSAVWVGRHLAGATTTHMLVRLRADTKEDTAYLYGFLQSAAAYQQIASLAYGGSIPHFDEAGIASVLLPLFQANERREVAQDVLKAVAARDDALDAEHHARALVVDAVENRAS